MQSRTGANWQLIQSKMKPTVHAIQPSKCAATVSSCSLFVWIWQNKCGKWALSWGLISTVLLFFNYKSMMFCCWRGNQPGQILQPPNENRPGILGSSVKTAAFPQEGWCKETRIYVLSISLYVYDIHHTADHSEVKPGPLWPEGSQLSRPAIR